MSHDAEPGAVPSPAAASASVLGSGELGGSEIRVKSGCLTCRARRVSFSRFYQSQSDLASFRSDVMKVDQSVSFAIKGVSSVCGRMRMGSTCLRGRNRGLGKGVDKPVFHVEHVRFVVSNLLGLPLPL